MPPLHSPLYLNQKLLSKHKSNKIKSSDMGNCLVLRHEGAKIVHSSIGDRPELEGERQSNDVLPDFENYEKVTKKTKKVRFADDRQYFGREGEGVDDGGASRTVRIKVVIRKKELLEMIERGRVSAGDDAASESRLLIESRITSKNDGCNGWEPVLEGIPEAM